MSDTLTSVAIGGVAGLVSAVITHWSTRAKIRLDLAAAYDKELQEKRRDVYEKLWALLAPLAKYGREKPVTYAVIDSISSQSRDWYFKVGGIYLTESSRPPYFHWKEQLQHVLDTPGREALANSPIPPAQLEALVQAGSALRTSLSDDIGTKRLSRV